MLKGSNMTALFNFIVLIPGSISNHKKSSSMIVKVHQKKFEISAGLHRVFEAYRSYLLVLF